MKTAVTKNSRNQTLFREVNEHIAALAGEWHQTGATGFICECSDGDCTETLELSPAEYEHVRADPACFVILPGHELAGPARVIERNDGFHIIESLGPAATIARAADPRQHA